jgi:uncharacterized protein (DUF1684 family)
MPGAESEMGKQRSEAMLKWFMAPVAVVLAIAEQAWRDRAELERQQQALRRSYETGGSVWQLLQPDDQEESVRE